MMEITNIGSRTHLTWLWVVVLFCATGALARTRGFVDVNDLPKFLPSSNNFTYRAGQVAVLDCVITNLGKKKVIWRRASDSTPLTVGKMSFNEDPRYAVQHISGTDNWNLVIRDVKKSDAGVYECQVSSRMRHLRHHVTLLVLDPLPPTASPTKKPKIQISGSNYVDEGDRIFLKCNATSKEYPPEDIDWFRSGNALSTRPAEGMFIRKHVSLSTGTIVSSMEIKHAKLSDQGTYVCRTSNRDVTSIGIHILKGDSSHFKRNTEKKIGGEPVYTPSKQNPAGGQHVYTPSKQNPGGGQESLRCNPVLLLVLSLMTSLITCLYTSLREIT